jgi:hypothetical protein
MTSIILVESGGTLKQSKVKDVAFDNLYKKCGFRVAEHFAKRTTWNVPLGEEMVSVELWSKDDGKAGSENKYDFPPPVDTALYFGTCVLIRVDEHENIINLSLETWNKMYDFLFGGFDDLDEEEEPSEDELEKVPQSMKTKHGYLKDGFVVDAPEDDDDDDDDDDDLDDDDLDDDDLDGDDDDDDDDAIVEKLVRSSNIKKNNSLGKIKEEDYNDDVELEGSELDEEEYVYSDD